MLSTNFKFYKSRIYLGFGYSITSQRLLDRTAQHIPKSIRNKSIPSRTLPTRNCKTKISTIHNCDSAIGFYLLQNDEYAKFYNDQQFSILAKARTPFHLAALEATYITIHQSYVVIKNLYTHFKFHIK